ncbi:hypothetical protein Q8A73_014727 [Channa argus]|nr:hypothetical protein Q8A73_014727 [Channa argus]
MWDTIEVFQQTYKYMICQSCCPEGALSQALALWLAITYAKICASPQAKAKAHGIRSSSKSILLLSSPYLRKPAADYIQGMISLCHSCCLLASPKAFRRLPSSLSFPPAAKKEKQAKEENKTSGTPRKAIWEGRGLQKARAGQESHKSYEDPRALLGVTKKLWCSCKPTGKKESARGYSATQPTWSAVSPPHPTAFW